MSSEKMKAIKSRIEQLEKQLSTEAEKENAKRRKAENRYKFILGGVLYSIEKKGFLEPGGWIDKMLLDNVKNQRDREFLSKFKGLSWK